MRVLVRTIPTGVEEEYQATTESTISDIQELIWAETGVPAEMQRLRARNVAQTQSQLCSHHQPGASTTLGQLMDVIRHVQDKRSATGHLELDLTYKLDGGNDQYDDSEVPVRVCDFCFGQCIERDDGEKSCCCMAVGCGTVDEPAGRLNGSAFCELCYARCYCSTM